MKNKMKTRKSIYRIISLSLCLLFLSGGIAKAQYSKVSFSGMWQYNSPDNNYMNKASGWGMGTELAYRVIPNLDLGLFLNWHTNNKYVSRKTYQNGTSSMTMDQSRSLYQLPFGVMANYIIINNEVFEPYFGLKMGANYARFRTDSNIFQSTEKTWGFYVAPEVGVTIYPIPRARYIGFKVAGYYSYSTNQYDSFSTSVDNLNNFGFRLGMKIKF